MIYSRFLYKATLIPSKIRNFFYYYFNPLYFRMGGAKVGKGMYAINRVYFSMGPNSTVEIMENLNIRSSENLNPLNRNIRTSIYVKDGAILKIGKNTGISSTCIWVNEMVKIGNNVKIGANCSIIDNDCHSLDWQIRKTDKDTHNIKSKPIIIGNDVLIGTGSIILKGVEIGEHSIIGAGSIVSKSIPSNCIAAGNPCKVIKYLND